MSVASEFDIQRQLITNAYNKLDDLGIDLTGIDKNIDNIAEMLDTVYEEYPKVTGTGTEVTLDGTKAGKLTLDVKGNSTQETTTGKNELNSSIDITASGVTAKLEKGYKFSFVGTSTASRTFQTSTFSLPAGTYRINFKYISGTVGNNLVNNVHSNTQNTNLTTITFGTSNYSTNQGATFTLEQEEELCLYFFVGTSGRTYNINYEVQIVEGSTADYNIEPFTYGASPNPSYPQEIYSAGDNGSISEKIVNKNLADIEGNGYISATGGITEGNPYRYTRMIPIPNNITNIYFYGSNLSSSLSNVFANRICFFDENKEKLGNVTTSIATSTSYSIPTGAKYVRASYSIATENFMLAFGTVSTYTAHQEQTYTIPCQQPMKSIGDVRDEFIQLNGEWKERHNIGFKTNITNWQSGGVTGVYYTTSITDYAISNNIPLCDYYIGVNNVTGASNMGTQENQRVAFINKSGSDTPRFYVKDTSITNLGDWVSAHNLKIVYVLETPTDLSCTAEQIAILENLPKSYNEQTNVYSLDVTPAYIEAKALKGE